MAYVPTSMRDGVSLMPRATKRREQRGPEVDRDFRQFAAVEAERARKVPEWREVYRMMMPDQHAFDDPKRPGDNCEEVVDSYPGHATQRGAGNVITALFPPERVWFEILAGRDIPEDQRDEVNEALEQYRDLITDAIAHSSFAGELNAMMLDVFCSLGGMRVERGPSYDKKLRIKAHPLSELYPLFDSAGDAEGCMRKHECRVVDIESEYGGYGRKIDIPQEMLDKAASDPEFKVWLLEVSRTGKDGRQTCTLYLYEKKQVLMHRVGYDPAEPPGWIITRWGRIAGSVYPKGPAHRALPTARMLNHVEDSDAKAFDVRNFPPTGVDIDSQINVNTVQLVPHAMIEYSSQLLNGAPPFQRVDVTGDAQFAQIKRQELRADLDEILFSGKTLPPVEDSHQMTAAEIRVRWMQKLREEGVDFGLLYREFGLGFISRVVWVLQTWGDIPPALRVNGRTFKIRYAGPLATAQDADDATNLETTIQASIATVGPEITSDRLKLEEVPAMLVRKRNAAASLIRSEEEADQRQQQRMAMQAAQVAAENGLLPAQQQGQQAA